MEGVRILAGHAVFNTTYNWGFNAVGLVLGLFAIFCLVLTIIDLVDGEDTLVVGAVFVLMLSFGSYFCFATANSEKVLSHIEYKVIIEDNVEFNEFLSHYEILEQDGEIYTVKEKGDMNE
jgi:hypothetical protein